MIFDHSKIKPLSTNDLLETPLVQYLLEVCQKQSEKIEELEAEIKQLKGHPQKPIIRPSKIELPFKGPTSKKVEKRAGSEKRQKTRDLIISKDEIIEAEGAGRDWVFKGYQDYIVQDIKIENYNVRYRLKRYVTPEGKYVTASLPKEIEGCHFGASLRRFILYQYYHCHVTQPILLEQLGEMGIDISSGGLSHILLENNEVFHQEKEALLVKGLEVSDFIQSDDTGARHNGKNGYCTVICNDLFTYFKSGESKSRINFLELLRTPQYKDYQINPYALGYMAQQNLPAKYQQLFEGMSGEVYPDKASFEKFLTRSGIMAGYAVRTITEGGLIGSIMEHGINKELAIISDDAGQFNVLAHGLCWVHAERNIQKTNCFTPGQEALLEAKLESFWELYRTLKHYKKNAAQINKEELSNQFDIIFSERTGFFGLDQNLEKIEKNKKELLLVLDRPEIPLHNNTSERDIREYVKKRKISGSTRSDEGQRCRDTFTSLKKTCRKNGISFWDYIEDRIKMIMKIQPLPELIVLAQKINTG